MAEYQKGDITNAKIIKLDDGYHVDNNGVIGDVLKKTKDEISYILTENESNRKFFKAVEVEKVTGTDDGITLTFKPSIKLGNVTREGGARIPNAKLIDYLSDEDKAEYMAIIERAKAAMEAARKKPMTEEEKIQAKIDKLMAQMAKLNAAKAETEEDAE